MSSGYMWPLVNLSKIIDAPGLYLTRAGDQVKINSISTRNDFNCAGEYRDGVLESWHRSGRILAGIITDNDIIGKLL